MSVGTAGGGSKTNVIAAEAWAEVDVRIARKADGAGMERKFRSLRAADRRCSVMATGGINRPPMERTAGTVKLYLRARALAGELGFKLDEAATGGASDGNFTSALGVATLDGMGAVGEGAHARHESIVIRTFCAADGSAGGNAGVWLMCPDCAQNFLSGELRRVESESSS